MKSIKTAFLLFWILVQTATPSYAQDNRTLDTKIADLLVQIPADNQELLGRQMKLLLELEEPGLQKLLDLVIPPGIGDDTKPRFAIESLSRTLSQHGLETEKKSWEAMILDKIKQSRDSYVQSFLMSQLNYIGGDNTVMALSKYFNDDMLYDPAIRAMRDANPLAASKVFVEYLNKTYGNVQIALVNAIGEIGIMNQAAAIGSINSGNSPVLQRSIYATLAKLGHPDSYQILMDAAKIEQYMPEPTNATGSLLSYAQTLSEKDNHSLSLKICKILMKKCTVTKQVHFKTRALIIAAGNDQIENSASMLVNALKSTSKQYRMAAIYYAAKNGSPVAPWVKALNSTKSNEVKSEILYLLGLISPKETAELVKGYMTDSDALVRQQAVKSFALIQKSKAVNSILNYTLSFTSLSDSETAKKALLQTATNDDMQLLANNINNAPESAKIVLVEVIASKGNSAYFNALFDQIEQPKEVRSVVLKNLFKVSSYDQLETLLILFDKLENEEEMIHVEKALVASVNDSPERSLATQRVLSYATEKFSIRKFVGVLGSLGGKEALNSVYNAYSTGDEITRKQALNALIKSADINALTAMFEICAGSNPVSDRKSAFKSYVEIVHGSTLPADQKLLLLRKVATHATDAENTRAIITAMGSIKTFLSFVSLSEYMDHEVFQTDAANALVNVVLPSEGLKNGFTGKIATENLIKALDIITGQDSEYLKIDIETYLEQMPLQTGFVSMFNGKDLSGWQGLATDPIKKKNLSSDQLKKLQDESNKKLRENWGVKDNCIVFNGHGSNLCSIKEYGSFEMVVDWRITKKGDSGIYLRGSPQIQIWDTTRVEAGAQVGSGGLYNNQIHESKPLLVADNPIGDWNTFHITMIDERVTVYLNGQLVVDKVVLENYWDRTIPIFLTGSIELQAHGTDLAFRDIYVKELDGSTYKLSEDEKAEGYEVLFNGMDLTGWTGKEHGYAVEDGNIVIRPQEGGGNLYTEKEYADFIFRFEFKLTPGANNGLGIRAPLSGNAAYAGYELQILDNTAPVYAKLKPYQYHGSVYGIIPAKRGFLEPVGQWNTQEVRLKGDDIKITLNGTIIVDGNIKEATRNGPADGKDHPGLKSTKGHIGFLGHGSLLWFRNIRIKEL